ncbi:MAG: cation transporter [Candidatus Poribacteria bacterium]|nr:cation transporter [Candidatus Poribacteria bacterium]
MQDALSKVAGISEVVSVSMDTNTAVVKVPRGKVASEVLVKAVESVEGRNFSAVVIEEVTLSVTGMVCDACPSKVQDALSKVAGVSEVVSVSTDTNTAVVKITQGKVTTEALIKAIAAIEGGSFKAQVAH